MNRKVGRVSPRPAEPEPKHLPLLHPMRRGRGEEIDCIPGFALSPLPTLRTDHRTERGIPIPRDGLHRESCGIGIPRSRRSFICLLAAWASRGEEEEKHARENLAENDRIQPIRLERAADLSQRRDADIAPYRRARFMAATHVKILEVFALHEPPALAVQPFVAYATKGCTKRFMVPMHDFEIVEASPEPPKDSGGTTIEFASSRNFSLSNSVGLLNTAAKSPNRKRGHYGLPKNL